MINTVISQEESLVHCTKLSQTRQKQLINWFKNQNILIKIDIFQEQKNQFFKLKNDLNDSKIIPFAAFLLAINSYYVIQDSSRKTKTYSLDNSFKNSKFMIKSKKKIRSKAKKEKLLNIWKIIEYLKEENFSYREISKYLSWRHRFKVSHAYIRQIWEELEDGN